MAREEDRSTTLEDLNIVARQATSTTWEPRMAGTAQSTRLAARPILKAGALAGLAAGVANLIVFFVGKAAGVPFEVNQNGTKTGVPFFMPLVASVVVTLLGAVVLWLLTGVKNGLTIWTALAVVFVVLYSVGALMAATSTSTGIVLTIMHIVGLAVAWVMLRPAAARG
jgi:hypothetical protein